MTTRIHYESVLAAAEAFAVQALRLQVLDPSDRNHGGFRSPEHWVCEPLAAANTLASLSVLYITPVRLKLMAVLLHTRSIVLMLIER